MNLPETSELQALVAVVHAGSVSGAAKELALPRATVSRRLARLEEKVGTRLVRRTTRQLRLTDAGEELFGHARGIVGSVETATRAIAYEDDTPRGLLRISVPPIGQRSFRDMLLAFSSTYPDVQLEVISTTRHQDLVADNIDVAWRAGPTLDPSLIAKRLSTSELRAVATPAYLEQHGTPSSVDDLADHACLVGFERGERAATSWPLQDGGTVRIRARLASNSLELLLDAVIAGHGIALLPWRFFQPQLDEGTLVPVLPGVLGTTSLVSLVFAERHLMRPAVRAFIDHAAAWWQDNPWPRWERVTL